jgi:hypothetical protein
MEYVVYVDPQICNHCCCSLPGRFYKLCLEILLNIFAYVYSSDVLCISKTISKRLAPIILPNLILKWNLRTKLNLYTSSNTYESKSIIIGGNRNFNCYYFLDPQDPNTCELNTDRNFNLSSMTLHRDPIQKLKMAKQKLVVLENVYNCDLKNVIVETKKEIYSGNKLFGSGFVYGFGYAVLCAMSLDIKINDNIFRHNRDAEDLVNSISRTLANSVRETLGSDIFE